MHARGTNDIIVFTVVDDSYTFIVCNQSRTFHSWSSLIFQTTVESSRHSVPLHDSRYESSFTTRFISILLPRTSSTDRKILIEIQNKMHLHDGWKFHRFIFSSNFSSYQYFHLSVSNCTSLQLSIENGLFTKKSFHLEIFVFSTYTNTEAILCIAAKRIGTTLSVPRKGSNCNIFKAFYRVPPFRFAQRYRRKVCQYRIRIVSR